MCFIEDKRMLEHEILRIYNTFVIYRDVNAAPIFACSYYLFWIINHTAEILWSNKTKIILLNTWYRNVQKLEQHSQTCTYFIENHQFDVSHWVITCYGSKNNINRYTIISQIFKHKIKFQENNIKCLLICVIIIYLQLKKLYTFNCVKLY